VFAKPEHGLTEFAQVKISDGVVQAAAGVKVEFFGDPGQEARTL